MTRMLRSNFHRQPGRVEGHGESCADCKPDEPIGRAAEKAHWRLDAENYLRGSDQ